MSVEGVIEHDNHRNVQTVRTEFQSRQQKKEALHGRTEERKGKKMSCTIKDSGERMEFDTGAVRDIQKVKGRCDLMPLDVVARISTPNEHLDNPDLIIGNVALFKDKGNNFYLYQALYYFAKQHCGSIPDMLLEVSKHFEEGAEKFGITISEIAH